MHDQTTHQAYPDSILQIRDLHTYFYTDLGVSKALNGVSLDVPRNRVMGIVGESGCGKSVTALSVLQLVPTPGRIVKGQVILRVLRESQASCSIIDEVNLTALNPRGTEIRRIRGGEIAMIFQEPMNSLNPSYTVGNQITEAILLHQDVDAASAEGLAIDMLDRVGLANPKQAIRRYPHELSGGMRQRAMIAMALSCTPSILFADEPTTALDVTTEAQILDLMRELQASMGMTIVFITHNLGVVAQMCDEVAVMYLGRVVELTSVQDLFYDPKHPYTQALLRSVTRFGSRTRHRLQPIRGVVPDPYTDIAGCPFHTRCDARIAGLCDVREPGVTALGGTRYVRCFLYSQPEEANGEG